MGIIRGWNKHHHDHPQGTIRRLNSMTPKTLPPTARRASNFVLSTHTGHKEAYQTKEISSGNTMSKTDQYGSRSGVFMTYQLIIVITFRRSLHERSSLQSNHHGITHLSQAGRTCRRSPAETLQSPADRFLTTSRRGAGTRNAVHHTNLRAANFTSDHVSRGEADGREKDDNASADDPGHDGTNRSRRI